MKHCITTILSLLFVITLCTSQNSATAGLASSPIGLNVEELDPAMDLFFELLDCGFTADEVSYLIEMVLDEGPTLFDPEDVNNTQRGYINWMSISTLWAQLL